MAESIGEVKHVKPSNAPTSSWVIVATPATSANANSALPQEALTTILEVAALQNVLNVPQDPCLTPFFSYTYMQIQVLTGPKR